MGGYGSGWHRHDKKRCVEDGLTLGVKGYKRFVAQAHEARTGVGGESTWRHAGEVTSSIGFRYHPGREAPDALAADGGGVCGQLRLHYTQTRGDAKEDLAYDLAVEVRPCHFGGWRLYLLCPLVVNGRACGARCEKVYLPPGGRHFGCRTCHELTYRSSQEAHHFDGLFKRLGARMGVDPKDVERALSNRY